MKTWLSIVLAVVVGIVASALTESARADFRMATGKYTGDGTGLRSIKVGFAPDVVLVKGNNPNGNDAKPTLCRTSTMVDNQTKRLDLPYVLLANRIVSLGIDSFTVGSDADVNQSAYEYYWIAFQKDVATLVVGSYTGNGVDNRNITTVGFQPNYVIVMSAADKYANQASSAMPAGQAVYFSAGPMVTDRIQALQSTGFQVGTNAEVNANGQTFHYVAWKTVTGLMNVGAYTGNGQDDRSISGVGFTPGFLIVRGRSLDFSRLGVHRTAASDATLHFRDLANYANGLQDLLEDGFQVGTDASVNANASIYYWIAFRQTEDSGAKSVRVLKWVESAQ